MTLVEVCVSMAVLAAAAGGMYVLANRAMRVSAQARTHYIAINIAKNRLEEAKSRDFSQLANHSESNTPVNANGVYDASGEFRRSTFVSGLVSGTLAVTVQVDIRDDSGQFVGESESVLQRLTDFQEKPR